VVSAHRQVGVAAKISENGPVGNVLAGYGTHAQQPVKYPETGFEKDWSIAVGRSTTFPRQLGRLSFVFDSQS